MSKDTFWFCTRHRSSGNTDYCAKCVEDFIKDFKNQPWVKNHE